MHEFSGKYLQWTPWYSLKGTLCKKSSHNNWPIANKLEMFVAHAWEIWNLNFQENLSIGTRNKAEKVHCSSSRVPLVTDRKQTYNFSRACAKCEVWIFKKIPPIEARLQLESTLLFKWSTRVFGPIATKRLLLVAHFWRERCKNFQENPPMAAEIQRKGYFLPPSKVPLMRRFFFNIRHNFAIFMYVPCNLCIVFFISTNNVQYIFFILAI